MIRIANFVLRALQGLFLTVPDTHQSIAMDKSAFSTEFQTQNVDGKIVAGLERISEAFRVLLWQEAKRLGLSPIQIQILIFVNYHPKNLCNVSALALEFNLTKPTISDAVKMLHSKNLIIKLPSAVDKRAYSITLTARGAEIVGQTKDFAQPIGVVMRSFSETEKKQFFDFIARTIEGLNKAEILTVQRSCARCRFFENKQNQPYCQLIEAQLVDGVRIDCPEFQAQI